MTNPTLTKETVRTVRQEVEAAITAALTKRGLKLTPKNITYDPYAGIVKFKCEIVFPNIAPPKAKSRYAGQTFTFKGDTYEVTDYVARRPKFPVVARNVFTGKLFKFPHSVLKGA